MRIYGLTGNIGCGKSTIAEILRGKRGVVVFDCDKIAKEIIADGANRAQVIMITGADIYLGTDSPNLKMLAEIVFSNHEVRKELEYFVHPLVWEHILRKATFMPNDTLLFVESAIIYEIGWSNKFTEIVVATCSEGEQARRLRDIRHMNDDTIRARISTQLPSSDKEVRGDYVVSTECSRAQLEINVNDLYLHLKQQGET